jgi:hypothetical protein
MLNYLQLERAKVVSFGVFVVVWTYVFPVPCLFRLDFRVFFGAVFFLALRFLFLFFGLCSAELSGRSGGFCRPLFFYALDYMLRLFVGAFLRGTGCVCVVGPGRLRCIIFFFLSSA